MRRPAGFSPTCMARTPSSQQIVRRSAVPVLARAGLAFTPCEHAVLWCAEMGGQAPAASPVSGPQDQGQDPSEMDRGMVTEG